MLSGRIKELLTDWWLNLSNRFLRRRALSRYPDDQLFCSKPFNWFEVSRGAEEGEVFVCCPTWLPKSIGNLARQSVAEIWNGKAAQQIRKSMFDGSLRHCKAENCPHLQEKSYPVQRIGDIEDPDLLRLLKDRVTILPHGPREINCSYDRSCNLSCPTCRTQVIMEHNRSAEILDIQQKINDTALADATRLYITGSGDPFGSPYFRSWLHGMRRSDMPNMREIHLHSNGQLWTERTWSLIPEEIRDLIRSADISIDAARPETYAINRRGGELERLLHNLEFISGLRVNGPIKWLSINMVVQDNNFEEMEEFVAMGKRYHCDTVYLHRLVNWGTFSDTEFAERAVHLPSHPRHEAFLDALDGKSLDDHIVVLGNLTELRRKKDPVPFEGIGHLPASEKQLLGSLRP
ncbi:MAG: SPASM domain-containing protein [Sphingomonadaceae bacterium]